MQNRADLVIAPRRALSLVCAVALASGALIAAPPPAAAQQSPFAAAVTVNDRVVTYYEIAQRARLLGLLNAPGDLNERARRTLVDERLEMDVARRFGLLPSAEEIQAGMAEFAARANMDAEQFLAALAQEGIAAQTFRDFVAAGIAWRNVVGARFGPRAQVSEEEIDRALTLSASQGGARIRVAEIVVPLTPENQEIVRTELGRLSETLDGDTAGFSNAARQFSAASTAQAGGVLDWRPLSTVPPELRNVLLTMNVGDVTDPIPLGPAVAIFQLRGLEETGFVTAQVTAVEYAEVLIPGGRTSEALAQAQELSRDLDNCDDFYGVLPGGFTITALPVGDVPGDISLELSRLDENEISTNLTRQDDAGNPFLLMLMLCGRSTELPEGGRDQVRTVLFQQRLESYANGFLAELRADAIISDPE